ncbi:transposase [Streptosporangium minutum]|uniref:transposase n=1 Tax=Streptosporangium minutum TaxID=569862 RepID=UPI001F6152B0|nr:transposase [Streptosporangium minutum]
MPSRPAGSELIPATTGEVAWAAFPKGSMAIRIRDELGALFEDEDSAEAFSTRGTAKTHLQHLLTAAAMNLPRIDAWLMGVPLAPTRTSHFAAPAA